MNELFNKMWSFINSPGDNITRISPLTWTKVTLSLCEITGVYRKAIHKKRTDNIS